MYAGKEPYIIIAQQEWALNLGSNARNLAVEISKDRPVLYVNPPMDVQTGLRSLRHKNGRKRIKLAIGMGANTIAAGPNLWVHTPACIGISINRLRNLPLYDRISRRNAAAFFSSISKALETLGWQKHRCVVLNDSQMFAGMYIRQYLAPLLHFYYIRDNLVAHPYFQYHGSRIEPQTIAQADAVFANSAYLAQYARQFNKQVYDIGQGCELDLYKAGAAYPEPPALSQIARPRIGYIGFLTGERLDITLLETLAEKRKDWNWVLIGPEEQMFRQSRLHEMSNVFFTGPQVPQVLPAFMQHLDVCINPQLVNPLTIGNYPRKIDEYLAMGKPTVATDTPAMQMFLPHVLLAKDSEGYIAAIEAALLPPSATTISEAIAFAQSHTWRACVENIYHVQQQLLHANTTVAST